MSELKTQKNDASVTGFLNGVEHEKRREDSFAILELMHEITGEEPFMWGPSIVGFSAYRYKYTSGREGKWFLTGFSPRKQNLTLYIMPGFERYEALLAKLGKFKTGKSCLYIQAGRHRPRYLAGTGQAVRTARQRSAPRTVTRSRVEHTPRIC